MTKAYQENIERSRLTQLIESAKEAREYGSYAPYSKFRVGAAVLTKGGAIYKGGNVENASYGATVCAERVAIFNAISAGEREFSAIAIVGDYPEPLAPCGICRQVISEFGSQIEVIMSNIDGQIAIEPIKALLPRSFKL